MYRMKNRLIKLKFMQALLFACMYCISSSFVAQAQLPTPEKYKLKNGMEVMYIPYGTLPVTTLTFYVNTGKKNETPGQQSLSELVLNVLLAGNEKYSRIEQDKILYELGNSITVSSNDNYSQIQFEFPNAETERALDLMASILLKPVFPEEDVNMYISRMKSFSNPLKSDISQLTEVYGNLFVYGSSHPLGRHFYDAQISKIKTDQIRDFYKFNYTPANTKLVISGNPDVVSLKSRISKNFENWNAEFGEVNGSAYDIPPIKKEEHFFIHKNASTQAALRWYKKAPETGSKDVLAFEMANAIFNTILFDRIRSLEGKTYGIYSIFNEDESKGMFSVFTQVRSEIMLETCNSFKKHLHTFYENGITQQELNSVKINLLNEINSIETPFGWTAYFNPWVYRDFNKRKNTITEIEKMDLASVNKVISKYFSPEAYKLFISGDQSILHEQLNKLPKVQYIDVKSIEVDN